MVNTIEFVNTVQSKQREALLASKSTPVLFYGGAKGGGKSYLVRFREIRRRLKYPNTKGLIVRKTYPELLSNHIRKFFEEYPETAKWFNKSEKVIHYPNGSITELSYLSNETDVYTYQGREYEDISIDEITQHEEQTFKILRTSLRTTNPEIKPRMLLTGNPGGIGHCVPFGEVLTSDGWKDISTIKVGNYVMSDVDGETKLVRVDQTTVEDYDGDLLLSDSNAARFTCTPNHKIVRVTETKNIDGRTFHKPSLIEVSKLPSVTRLPEIGTWRGYEIPTFTIANTEKRKKRKPQPLTISGNDYCELMGWYLSEGYYNTKLGYFGISQTKEPNKLLIEKLLTRCGFNYKWDGSAVIVYSRSWADYFSVFGKCRDKFIPRILKEAPPEQLQIFLDAIMLGDGCGNHYYTISKQLADDISEIGLKLSNRVYLSSRQRNNRKGLSYDVSLKDNKLGWLEKSKIRKEYYKGKVYCLGIDGIHRFYLRQNGTIYLSGNSWVKRIFIDKNYRGGEMPEDYGFVQAFVSDNTALLKADPEYVRRLEDLPDHLRKAYLEGDWNIFAGQAFPELSTQLHVVQPFALPPNTRYFFSFDPGYNHPFAFIVFALVPEGTLYVTNYITGRLMMTREIAEKIKELNIKGEIYSGQDLWYPGRGGGKSLLDEFAENGINAQRGYHWIRAKTDRIRGVQAVRSYVNPKGYSDNKPRVFFFSNALPVFDSVASMQIDPKNPEDVVKVDALDGEGGDDLYDAFRYGVMSRVYPNSAQELEPEVFSGDWVLQNLSKQREEEDEWL